MTESSQTLEEQISIFDVLTSRSGELSEDVQARLLAESNRNLEEQISVSGELSENVQARILAESNQNLEDHRFPSPESCRSAFKQEP